MAIYGRGLRGESNGGPPEEVTLRAKVASFGARCMHVTKMAVRQQRVRVATLKSTALYGASVDNTVC